MATKSTHGRHCAYCLKFLPAATAKRCGKCHRRAYCSEQCQALDWGQVEGSQGHKNWCGIECGEEDIDWEVKEIPGKGLGLVAKRMIPRMSRIMVDAIRKLNHPAIQDLAPVNGTVRDKITLNSLKCFGYDDGVLCLRIARANHNCDPNANHYFDFTFRVKILYATRDIQPGEEICISYYSCIRNDPNECRGVLKERFGIDCKVDCFCRDAAICEITQKYRELSEQMNDFVRFRRFDAAMENVRTRVKLLDSFGAVLTDQIWTYCDGFKTGIMYKSTLQEGVEYGRRILEIQTAILHPESKELLDQKVVVENPKTHPCYLIGESEK